jgi:hypothetical protein
VGDLAAAAELARRAGDGRLAARPSCSEQRLADLAAAEMAGAPLPRGLADRLVAVEARLAAARARACAR